MAPILDLCYLLMLIVMSPYFLYKQVTTGKYRMHMRRRLGLFPRRPASDRKCLLIHGVSVGEILAAKPVVAALREAMPDWDIALSVTTDTGWAVAEKTYPELARFRFPLDFSFSVKSFLSRVRPDAIVIMELELWPNFLRLAYARGIPVVVANGRISERSFRRYSAWRGLVGWMFRLVTHYLVQDDTYRQRLLDLGVEADRVDVSGTVKYDAVSTVLREADRAALRKRFGFSDDTVVLMGASTHPPEEEHLLYAYRELLPTRPNLRLLLVPRHPQRFEAVYVTVENFNIGCKRKSELDGVGNFYCDAGTAILGDTMGEMPAYYAAADLVFVGGSLIEHGGQNMLEPAGQSRPTIFGPHVWNFEEPAKVLLEAGAAVQVSDRHALSKELALLIDNPDLRARRAAAGKESILSRQGASRYTAKRVCELLGKSNGR